jgi:hypothetical protein
VRLLSYRVAFVVCLVSVTMQALLLLGAYTRLIPGAIPFASVFTLFGNPVPAPLSGITPWFLRLALVAAFAALLYRRLWFAFRAKALHPPASLSIWPARLLVVAVAFLFVGLAVLALSILLRAGSGVPAGMLALPALLLLSPVLFYVELRSLLLAKASGQ